MSLTEKVHDDVMGKAMNRYSQTEIAKMFGLRQSQISPLIRGERKFSGITLGTFDRMYPNATVCLTGGDVGTITLNSHNSAGGDINIGGINKDAFRKELLKLKIDPVALVQVIQLLEDF